MKYRDLIEKMTLQEKAAYCSGYDMWHLNHSERLGIPKIMVTDGPHGLRKQSSEQEGNLHNSQSSTCFPPSCTTAASWDESLLHQIGSAIGKEARREQVSAVLGPGANIKRSPLCGRNFEYYSEDPLLSGKMAAAFIKGMQSEGVGATVKHFCANNQESYRFTNDSVIDERALREIYLRPFEIAVREGGVSAVMTAYNKLNGTFCSEHERLLKDVLRGEWGFEGIVMSDWGGTNDRVEGIKAGLHLEMPGSGGLNDADIVRAVEDGLLEEGVLDACVNEILTFLFAYVQPASNQGELFTAVHDDLAREAAEQSAVLLKNEAGKLPLRNKGDRILVIGEMAKHPRYQGSGSSHINPNKLTSFLDALTMRGIPFEYEPGYDLRSKRVKKALIERAVQKAAGYKEVVIFAGLPDMYETEGLDRKSMRLPPAHRSLILSVAAANRETVVVLSGGAPVMMEWEPFVKSILLLYLPGQAGGAAAANLLFGDCSPCGKLPESFPLSDQDVPCAQFYPGNQYSALYKESIYVGYRYYDTADIAVKYPFGYGLSYTDFYYSHLYLDAEAIEAGQPLRVSFKIKNTGEMPAKEITQIYVRKGCTAAVFRPEKELKAFTKTALLPGQTKVVTVTLDAQAFAFYHTGIRDWYIEDGEYEILVGASSKDICLRAAVTIHNDLQATLPDLSEQAPWYYAPDSQEIPLKAFNALCGRETQPIIRPIKRGQFTPYHSMLDIQKRSLLAKIILRLAKPILRKAMHAEKGDNSYLMIYEVFRTAPLRNIALTSQGAISMDILEGMVTMFNGKFFKGLSMIRQARKQQAPVPAIADTSASTDAGTAPENEALSPHGQAAQPKTGTEAAEICISQGEHAERLSGGENFVPEKKTEEKEEV